MQIEVKSSHEAEHPLAMIHTSVYTLKILFALNFLLGTCVFTRQFLTFIFSCPEQSCSSKSCNSQQTLPSIERIGRGAVICLVIAENNAFSLHWNILLSKDLTQDKGMICMLVCCSQLSGDSVFYRDVSCAKSLVFSTA